MRLMKPPLPNPRGGKAIPPLTVQLDHSMGWGTAASCALLPDEDWR
jgi:hypothetical protein